MTSSTLVAGGDDEDADSLVGGAGEDKLFVHGTDIMNGGGGVTYYVPYPGFDPRPGPPLPGPRDRCLRPGQEPPPPTFFRLFGDYNGDDKVDASDHLIFRNEFRRFFEPCPSPPR